jgi:putative ABC transport system permease protein
MSLPAKLRSFLRNLFSSHRVDADLDHEVHAHLSMLIDENIRAGMSPDKAQRAARMELGGIEQVKQQVRDRRMGNWLHSVLSDCRYGVRQLRKNPGFTAVAILTLAFGIGANTAIFSVVDAVLLRPLPFQDPSRLVVFHEGVPKMGYPKMGFSPPDLAVFAREQKSSSAIGAFQNTHVNISGRGEPERVAAARVSSSLFPLLSVQPILGRIFAIDEDSPGHNVVLLSYGLWQRRYGSAPSILGQTIDLDRQPYTIIGVMPQNFEFPLRGTEDNGSPADLWVPMAFTPAELQGWGGSYFTSVVGRLWPGVTLEQARGEAESLGPVILASYPPALTKVFGNADLKVSASPFHEEVVGSVRTLLLVLMAAVGFVLLIACANIATLLVSRAATRQKEMAVRTALGATRLRLVSQMLTESLLFAFGGGILGFMLAFWARNFILGLVPSSIPLPRHVALNGSVFAFAIGASIVAALLFGVVPAVQVSSASLQGPLQERGRNATPSRSRHRLQGFFVASEFALALVLLVGAGLLIRSFGKLLQTNPGFRPENVLTLNIPLPRQAYPGAMQIQNFYEELLERVSNLPGVQSVALANDLPLNAREMVSIAIEGQGSGEGETPQAICQTWVMGDYFSTMGVPLIQGRSFTAADRFESQPVTIVNLAAAKKFWPGESAIGKHVRWGVNAPWQTIVGIVGDVSQGPLNTTVAPHIYRPYNQLPGPFLEEDPFSDWHAMNVALRTHADPASLTSAVVTQVHALDPDLAVTGIQTMTQVISSSVAGPEFNMAMIAALAGLALFLSAIGVYGVLAYVVAQQTHEIGVRMALGAKPGDVLRLIVGRGARLAGVGGLFGLGAALALTRLIKSMLYGVSAIDPLTFAGVVALLTIVALLASYIPARRATKVDPMIALRYE